LGDQEFDAEKYFMRPQPWISQRDIEKYGMCLEDPEKECHDSCSKWLKRKCGGAVLIRQAGGKTWMSRGWYKAHVRE